MVKTASSTVSEIYANEQALVRHSVSWSSILAGSLAIVAIAGTLSILGIAIGLGGMEMARSASPKMMVFGIAAVYWIIVVQWLASAFGGYITGRLRSLWIGVHPNESYFRDTAHGFLAWCIAVIFITTVTMGISSSEMPSFFHENVGSLENAASVMPTDYDIDALLRQAQSDAVPADGLTRREIALIYAHDGESEQLPPQDRDYVAQIIKNHTKVEDAEADHRISALWALQKEHAAQMAKEASRTALATFFALLIGAFIASAAAAFGGLHRDEGWGSR